MKSAAASIPSCKNDSQLVVSCLEGTSDTCICLVVNLPRRHSQGNIGRLGLGKSLIVPHHGAQETQTFGNSHEGDEDPVACSVERGDQRGEIFWMAARRFEQYIDLALDGPFAC